MGDDASVRQVSVAQTDAAGRVVAVDVLRGFDMFWLVGGTGFGIAIARLLGGNIGSFLESQFGHADWVGFTFYDLIFPLFAFLVGMSLVFSLERRLQSGGRWAAYKRLLRRAVLLYLMGLVYYGGFSKEWPDIRLLGVLQRLALCYLFAGILFIHLRPRGLIIACLFCLIGYWLLLSFVPVPGKGQASFDEHANWAWYVDKQFLPGHKHYGDYDPEGLLSTIPAVATCLLGVFAAFLLRTAALTPWRKAVLFLAGGAGLAALGYLWGLQFPVIKKIWTSSYVLVAGDTVSCCWAFFMCSWTSSDFAPGPGHSCGSERIRSLFIWPATSWTSTSWPCASSAGMSSSWPGKNGDICSTRAVHWRCRCWWYGLCTGKRSSCACKTCTRHQPENGAT